MRQLRFAGKGAACGQIGIGAGAGGAPATTLSNCCGPFDVQTTPALSVTWVLLLSTQGV